MGGLDPPIHHEESLTREAHQMDGRVRPGHDVGGGEEERGQRWTALRMKNPPEAQANSFSRTFDSAAIRLASSTVVGL